jgi:patatin-related protein
LSFWPHYNPAGEDRVNLRKYWETFFYPDYAQSGTDFSQRSFGDGGYLDNKPFSYATRSLMRRRGTLPVKRKLVYIDPSPEQLKSQPAEQAKPDFIRNCMAALLDLPRYETIREDIQVVIERNKLLDTVNALTGPVDQDVERQHERDRARAKKTKPDGKPESPQPLKTYQETGLSERMETDGVGYGTYHRLRVRGVTSKIAGLISRASHLDPESEECQPIRWIIEKWVDEMFAEDPDQGAKVFATPGDQFPEGNTIRPRSTQACFLASFDIEYRMRRIFFLQRRIGDLLRLDPAHPSESADPSRVRLSCPDWLAAIINDTTQMGAFRSELLTIKRGLDEPLSILTGVERATLKSAQIGPMLQQALSTVKDGKAVVPNTSDEARQILRGILEKPDQAETIYKNNRRNVDAIARYIAALFDNEFKKARAQLISLLPHGAPDSKPLEHEKLDGKLAAHAALQGIARQFDYYDAVIFPIQYGTDSGEANRVDIVRISPPDAQQLIDESSTARRKLAGTALFSFGAFLARFWRENDMLWGRLDAAEVLIKSLLQNTPAGTDVALVNNLVNEAQRDILSQTLTLKQRQQLWGFICEAFAASSHGRGNKPPSDVEIRRAVSDLLKELPDLDHRLRTVLRFAGVEKDEELREYFATKYEVRRQLAATEQLRLTARAGRIVSRMLNIVARNRGLTAVQKHTALLPRVAAVVWGLVEISIPRTVGWLLWDDWRHRFYSWGLILLIAGLFWQPLVVAGACILGATLFIDVVRWWIGDLVRATGRWRSVLTLVITAIVAVVLTFCAIGMITSWKWIQSKVSPPAPVHSPP